MQRKFIPAYLLTLVNVLGFSLLLPVLPFVVTKYGGSDAVYGFLISAYAFCQFLAAPWLGRLSDTTGRKPVLLISQAGTLLSWVVFGLAWFLPDLSLWWISLPLLVIALSRVCDGLTGGNNSVAQAYISDISSHAEKGVIFGTMGGIVGIGMVIGPGVGGFLASGSWGFLGVAICGFALSALTLISIQTALHESLAPEQRKPYVKEPLSRSFRLIYRIKTLAPGALVERLFVVRVCFSTTMAAYVSTIPLFMIDTFEFNARELGLFMVFVGLFLAFNQAVLSKWFIGRIGELGTLKLGFCLTLVGLFAITVTENLWLYVPCYYVLNLGFSLTIPTLTALVAQHANPRDMGEVMGIGDSIASLSNALIPIVAASAYGFLGEQFYHLVAAIPAVGLLIGGRIRLPPPKRDEDETHESGAALQPAHPAGATKSAEAAPHS